LLVMWRPGISWKYFNACLKSFIILFSGTT
jgi:hypothetical protein